jgi:hypothetical protein
MADNVAVVAASSSKIKIRHMTRVRGSIATFCTNMQSYVSPFVHSCSMLELYSLDAHVFEGDRKQM